MTENYILAIDQGTTGSTAVLIDSQLNFLAKANQEFPQIYPQPGWVEHDPEEIWKSVLSSIQKVLQQSKIDPKQISAIGITNQRETVSVWDKDSLKPLRNSIVWQCRRTAELCSKLRAQGLEEMITDKTGLLLDPYFSGSKIRWMMEEEGSRVAAQVAKGQARFGTIDTYILARLTQGESFYTEPSNACRLMMMGLKSLDWDEELLKLFKVPRSALPKIKSSDYQFGQSKGLDCLPDGIPIVGILGDQQAALFGQASFEPGHAKCTYGTGSFLLVNTGSEPLKSNNRLLTSVAWQIKGKSTYCLEGSAFIAGAAVQWLRDELKIVDSAPEVEALAAAANLKDMGDLIVVPAFTGLGAPHWKADARGLISGITRGTNRSHIARATLESIALQNFDLVSAMDADGQKLEKLKVDGGAAANDLLMQIQSNLIGKPCVRPQVIETTALGAAMIAGLGAGIFSDLKSLESSWQEDKTFNPESDQSAYYEKLKSNWQVAVQKA